MKRTGTSLRWGGICPRAKAFWAGVFLFLFICPQAFAQVKGITPLDLKKMLKKNPEIQLIDVRETWEVERAKISGSRSIPLKEISSVHDKLDMSKPVITYCHHGPRGQTAAEILYKMGFVEVYNLEGGIHAYALEADTSIPLY
jgi:rhodanese-related sulfurtransferase